MGLVRVLYAVDSTDDVVDASMTVSSTPPGRNFRGLPAGFVVDEDYEPVPIRTSRPNALARVEHEQGGRYLLRGELEDADLPKIRYDADGVLRVFSDPQIDTMLGVCGSDPPIGNRPMCGRASTSRAFAAAA
ncbi:hypothetical protein [Salinarimonas chemoclinalis]|uniref:hypothetical protein n=1 Tax=Salinarimonas chemoclinalis TaxID=3241599 RepID=UPI003557F1F2